MSTFKFNLHDRVKLTESSESGVVVGRAEYINMTSNYYVRYVKGDGCQTEIWWPEDALEAA